jgi:hypothetical protein
MCERDEPGKATTRAELERLAEVLRQFDRDMAPMIEDALRGPDEDLEDFLVSNDLWGGMGSVADQAGTGQPRAEARRRIEAALISLGELQIASGRVNPRTAMWVSTFKEWRRKGI